MSVTISKTPIIRSGEKIPVPLRGYIMNYTVWNAPDGEIYLIYSENAGVFMINIDNQRITPIFTPTDSDSGAGGGGGDGAGAGGGDGYHKDGRDVRGGYLEDGDCWIEYLHIIPRGDALTHMAPLLLCGEFNRIALVELVAPGFPVYKQIETRDLFTESETDMINDPAIDSCLYISNIHVCADNRHLILHTTDHKLRVVDIERGKWVYYIHIIPTPVARALYRDGGGAGGAGDAGAGGAGMGPRRSQSIHDVEDVEDVDNRSGESSEAVAETAPNELIDEVPETSWGLRIRSRMSDCKRSLVIETDSVEGIYCGFAVVDIDTELSVVKPMSRMLDEEKRIKYYTVVNEGLGCASAKDGDVPGATVDGHPYSTPMLHPRYYRRFSGHRIDSIEMTPNNRFILLTISQAGEGHYYRPRSIIYLYDFDTGTPAGFIHGGHQDRINTIAFTRDSKYMLTTGSDDTMRLWDFNARRQIAVLSDKAYPDKPYNSMVLGNGVGGGHGDDEGGDGVHHNNPEPEYPMVMEVFSQLEFWGGKLLRGGYTAVVQCLAKPRSGGYDLVNDDIAGLDVAVDGDTGGGVDGGDEDLTQWTGVVEQPPPYCFNMFDLRPIMYRRKLAIWRTALKIGSSGGSVTGSGTGSNDSSSMSQTANSGAG